MKDIVRVERFVAERPGSNGAVICCLTNDGSYWNAPSHGRDTNAHAFRIHEGTVLAGSRAWGPLTGAGSSKGREAVLDLAGEYRPSWQDYSVLPGRNGAFRALLVPVPARG